MQHQIDGTLCVPACKPPLIPVIGQTGIGFQAFWHIGQQPRDTVLFPLQRYSGPGQMRLPGGDAPHQSFRTGQITLPEQKI